MTTGVLTDKQLAAEFSMSIDYVREQCRSGRWPHRRFGTRIRFTTEDVAAILSAHGVEPADAAGPPDTVAGEDAAAIAWGRSTRSVAQRNRATRARQPAS